MDEKWLESLETRIVRIENKVDSLLSFRGWVLGVGAGISAVVSVFMAWFTTK